MPKKQIRFSITDKEYNQIVKASVALAKSTGKIMSVHQYVKKVAMETIKTK
jgi:hypothetical protein